MLKRKISKDEFDKLSDALKGEYKASGSDYVLDTDDASELERARDREKQKAKEEKERADKLQRELDEAKAKLDDDATKDAKKRGDIETLEKSWKDKHDKTVKEFTDKLASKDAFLSKQLVDNVALQIATKISTAPAVILPHIKARLQADLDGESPATRVLDKDGKPSALSIEDLSKEFVANKDFAAIIVASKGSGGSAPKNGLATKPGSATANPDNTQTLAAMKPADLAASIKARKEAETSN